MYTENPQQRLRLILDFNNKMYVRQTKTTTFRNKLINRTLNSSRLFQKTSIHFVDKSKVPTINDDRLKSLCILTYSDNVELQRSAALCFAEFSDRSKYPPELMDVGLVKGGGPWFVQ